MLFPYENEMLELEPFSLPITKVSNVHQQPQNYQQHPVQFAHQSYAPSSSNANMSSGYRQTYSTSHQQPPYLSGQQGQRF